MYRVLLQERRLTGFSMRGEERVGRPQWQLCIATSTESGTGGWMI